MGRELEGKRPSQIDDRALRGAVGNALAPADRAVNRRDIHDPSAAPGLDHSRGRGLGHEDEPFQVDVNDRVPRVGVERVEALRDVRAGVVHENVNASPFAVDALEADPDRCLVPHLEQDCERTPPLCAQCNGDGFRVVAVARGDSDVGAGVRECQRDRPTDAAGATGDERSLSFQTE